MKPQGVFFFINVMVSVYSLSDFFFGLYMPLYCVWLLRKCGKERKFSSIGKCGKVFVFFWVVGGWGILFDLVEETRIQ